CHGRITPPPYAPWNVKTHSRGRRMRFGKWLTVIVLASIPSTAFAQSDQGRISGNVRDQTNAFVAAANVKIKNERTGEERTASSNDSGFFLVTSLKPSTYTVTINKPGFGQIEYTAMPLAVGQ